MNTNTNEMVEDIKEVLKYIKEGKVGIDEGFYEIENLINMSKKYMKKEQEVKRLRNLVDRFETLTKEEVREVNLLTRNISI